MTGSEKYVVGDAGHQYGEAVSPLQDEMFYEHDDDAEMAVQKEKNKSSDNKSSSSSSSSNGNGNSDSGGAKGGDIDEVSPPLLANSAVDLVVVEKAQMILEFLQLYSLLLTTSFSVWPTKWLHWTKSIPVIFNLDAVMSAQSTFHEYNGFNGRFFSCVLGLCAVPTFFLLLYKFLERSYALERRAALAHWKIATTLILDFMLVPILTNVARLFHCREGISIVGVTHQIEYSIVVGLEVDKSLLCSGKTYW